MPFGGCTANIQVDDEEEEEENIEEVVVFFLNSYVGILNDLTKMSLDTISVTIRDVSFSVIGISNGSFVLFIVVVVVLPNDRRLIIEIHSAKVMKKIIF
jgi:hypothetical protein